MSNFKINTFLYPYLNWVFALFVTFLVLSLTEIIVNFNQENSVSFLLELFLLKGLNDFWTVLIISLVVYPIYFITNFKAKENKTLFLKITGILLVIIQFCLINYSLVTLVNLGSDLLGYSYKDISLTIAASNSFSFKNIFLIILFPILFLVANYFLSKKNIEKLLLKLAIFLLFISTSFQFTSSKIKSEINQNKLFYLVSDIVKSKRNTTNNAIYEFGDLNEFPLLKSTGKSNDVLGSFFKKTALKPNLVFIILEGLGTEFVDENSYSGFSPFIDSLINKSLYWENFLSTTGRTFGVIPSLFASLPFGEIGFLELENLPTHNSIFRTLKENGYTTSFYSGTQSSFDKIFTFLVTNKVDNIIDENKFGPNFSKAKSDDKGFSWGYPDAELFKKTLVTIDEIDGPRLDVLLTLTNHNPFIFPDKQKFIAIADSIAKERKINISANKDVFAALNYVDTSLKTFIEALKKRNDYKNTIFVITGDHRLIPVAQKDKICRFHVPLLIYSPMLKEPKRFQSISSHWDIAPSILSFLEANYNVNLSKKNAWLGTGLDTVKKFRNLHQIPLMRYKGNLNDFVYKDYFYSEGELFKINNKLEIRKIRDDKIFKEVIDTFARFKQLNSYVTKEDKIYPKSLIDSVSVDKYIFKETELEAMNPLVKNKKINEIFLIARDQAFSGNRELARLLCNYIINQVPNHVDAIILKARTLSWDGKYNEAEQYLLRALKMYPFYDDPYLAILDLYWWSNKEIKSIEVVKKAMKNKIANPNLSFKLSKAYFRLGKKNKSEQIIDSILALYPENKEFIEFKKTLKK